MSAFLVSQDTLNLIVNASDTPTKEAFDMLLKENLRSLDTRYPDQTAEDKAVAETYVFEVVDPAILVSNYGIQAREVPNQIVKSCRCLDYQSCENTDWESTPAYEFIEKVRAKYVPLQVPENQASNIQWNL